MELSLEIGLSYTAKKVVTKEMTAKHVGSGVVDVFATPMMIALMEEAAYKAVKDHLPSDFTTVGTYMESSHLAATPVGMEVRAQAKLVDVDGKKLIYEVEAYDEKDCIGKGVHTRFVVNSEKFHSKVNEKK